MCVQGKLVFVCVCVCNEAQSLPCLSENKCVPGAEEAHFLFIRVSLERKIGWRRAIEEFFSSQSTPSLISPALCVSVVPPLKSTRVYLHDAIPVVARGDLKKR